MDRKTFERLKREGRLPRVKPRNGFDRADDIGLYLIVIAILLIILENRGWM